MRILLYRNCQVLSVFSLEPLLGGTSTMPWLRPGRMEEPAVFANVKKNKAVAVQRSPFHEDFIYIVPNSKQLWDGSLSTQE
jgi:hypothetical protein